MYLLFESGPAVIALDFPLVHVVRVNTVQDDVDGMASSAFEVDGKIGLGLVF